LRWNRSQTGSHSGQKAASRKLNLDSRAFENIVSGVFTPVLAKHSKSFNLIDTLAVG